MRTVHIAILGLGTVGSAVVDLLQKNKQLIKERTGLLLKVEHVLVADINKPRACALTDITITNEIEAILNNQKIELVVELIGGTTVAKELVSQALQQGKSVVTANKALIAEYGEMLFALAKQQGAVLKFEAAVAGGIPIIKTLQEGLVANKVQWLAGIINGTSNYILSEMAQKQADFGSVLANAQQLGYAEADPSFDINGLDAAHKLAILSRLAFGELINLEQIKRQGIEQLTLEDIGYAKELGFIIKHLGIAQKTKAGLALQVQPTLVPESSLLSHVNGVNNAVMICSDALGVSLCFGQGAGGLATASAVVADIVDVSKQNKLPAAIESQAMTGHEANISSVSTSDIKKAFYLRLQVNDRAGMLADIASKLGKYDISIVSLLQKGVDPDNTPIIIQTHPVDWQSMQEALKEIATLRGVSDKFVCLPIEWLDSEENLNGG